MNPEAYQLQLRNIRSTGRSGRALLLKEISEKLPHLKQLAEDTFFLLYAEAEENRMQIRNGTLNEELLFFADQAVKNLSSEVLKNGVQSLGNSRDDYYSVYPELIYKRLQE